MTKDDLVQAIANEAGIGKTEAEKALSAVIGGIKDSLSRGDRVLLTGFGSFLVKERKARTGRNPRTGETIQIPAKRVAAFKPGKELTAVL